jgi:Phage tail assembly chaperone protein
VSVFFVTINGAKSRLLAASAEDLAGLFPGATIAPDTQVADAVDPLELELARLRRNGLLAATDWAVAAAHTLKFSDYVRIFSYRQALRDIPATWPDPQEIIWPDLGTFAPTIEQERTVMRAARRSIDHALHFLPASAAPLIEDRAPDGTLLEAVDSFAASLGQYDPLRQAREKTTEYVRLHADVAAFQTALGITPEQTDALFRAAMQWERIGVID